MAEIPDDIWEAARAHELYRFRPKAFEGFITYARAAIMGKETG